MQFLQFYKNGQEATRFSIHELIKKEKDLYLVSTVGPGGVVMLRYSGSRVSRRNWSFSPEEEAEVAEPRVLAEVVVVWDVWETAADEMQINEGDVLEVFSMPPDQERWYGKNKRSGQVGFFRQNYVFPKE